jgi:AcrR family transcriptional regulator
MCNRPISRSADIDAGRDPAVALPPRIDPAARREAIVDAAVEEIADSGFAGATTAAIARRAGISQPYVFRFFPTKKDLMLAVIDRAFGRILADWERVLPEPGETRLAALGRVYVAGLTERRAELMVQLQAYGGANDPEIAEALRHHLSRIYRYVVYLLRRDGHDEPEREAAAFCGRGFLISASMAIGLESVLTPEEWGGICKRQGVGTLAAATPRPDPDPPAA